MMDLNTGGRKRVVRMVWALEMNECRMLEERCLIGEEKCYEKRKCRSRTVVGT